MPNLPSHGGSAVASRAIGAAKPPVVEEVSLDDESRRASLGRRLRRLAIVSAISLALHAAVLTVLGMIILPADFQERIFTILASRETAEESAMTFETVEIPETLDDFGSDSNVEALAEVSEELNSPIASELSLDPTLLPETDAPGPPIKLSDATSGRGSAAKQALLQRFGGNAASEASVNSGLKWLATIQQPDGSWSFRNIGGAPNPGTIHEGTEMGATACALLAYLGAGHTHRKDGPYQDAVRKGVNYLIQGGKIVPAGGDYRGEIPNDSHASMYIQGLVTIALAETHAMTNDRRLKPAVSNAVRFIVAAQDPKKGGWRYRPGIDSDTSVVGWQLMALKSAQAAKIHIPPQTFVGVAGFLDSVAADDGSKYGYTGPQTDRPSTTAIGLLCRMYLGWDHDVSALKAGVEDLAKRGPDFNDLYYTYYATQAVHHWGGEEWNVWNEKTRDGLVARQVKAGDHAGSWNPGGTYSGQSGGRLFDTCLAIMTLEVYYRHLPLYERENLKIEF
ncbi:MAG: prenyltransferase/squalene oxidase repeat-containing protein [Planctomycetaceae bacterium]